MTFTLLEQIGYFPIPRIEYTDESFDLVVENLALSGRNILPNLVHVDAHNRIQFSPYNSIPDTAHHELVLTSKVYVSTVTAVDPHWLADLGGVFYSIKEKGYSAREKRITASRTAHD